MSLLSLDYLRQQRSEASSFKAVSVHEFNRLLSFVVTATVSFLSFVCGTARVVFFIRERDSSNDINAICRKKIMN